MPISRGVTRNFARSLSRAFVRSAKNNIVPFFLELFPGAAAAYSLRQLHPDALFAIRVRRSSDSQEMDIGFTSAGVLDESALLLFVGSGDGFVVIWYDQSGNNNHANQAVASQQPKIVDAGAVIKENGKPAIDFDGVDDHFQTPNNTIGSTNNLFVFAVGSILAGDNKSIVAGSDGGYSTSSGFSWFVIRRYQGVFQTRISEDFTGYEIKFTFENNNFNLFNLSYSSGSLFESSVNNSVVTGTSFSETLDLTAEVDIRVLDNVGNKLVHSLGRTSELIIYTTDQSTNRFDIKNNINNYYSNY